MRPLALTLLLLSTSHADTIVPTGGPTPRGNSKSHTTQQEKNPPPPRSTRSHRHCYRIDSCGCLEGSLPKPDVHFILQRTRPTELDQPMNPLD